MHQLYGASYKPKINYPTLKTRKGGGPNNNSWMPNNKNSHAVDPRTAKFNKQKALAVKVPKSKQTRHGYAAVDLVPKRRSADDCNQFIDDINMRTSAYRPAHTQAYSSNDEKER
jgi:hypothetical protein